MIDIDTLLPLFRSSGLEQWGEKLPLQLEKRMERLYHGDFGRWQHIYQDLPKVCSDSFSLTEDAVSIGSPEQLPEATAKSLEQSLRALQPWRKGPYSVFGIDIDTEWRSDWKWNRVLPHLKSLQQRRILDVGCGNGYHCWRMAGEGASLVVGIDPNLLFLTQFSVIKRLMCNPPEVHLLPLGVESLPSDLQAFDTVFSMGVLYHRRSPIEHLLQLRGALRRGGELVLETLVIEGGEDSVLIPRGRYAKMRNVWFIPSVKALSVWLQRSGFSEIHVADSTQTTTMEQRATGWMSFESLADFLDPDNRNFTVEGYPAPCRATLIAKA